MILTKIMTLLRKADCKQFQVLTAKHTASLQLLCTVGGNQARSDAHTEFKILEHSLRGGVEASRAHSCIFYTTNHSICIKRSRTCKWLLLILMPANLNLVPKLHERTVSLSQLFTIRLTEKQGCGQVLTT